MERQGFHTEDTTFTHPGRACLPAHIMYNRNQSNKLEVHHHETTEVNNTMNLQQVQNNEVYVNSHDPAVTQMVEQVAEARHREALANTENMVQMMVTEMSGRFHAEEEAASARMHQMMMLAEVGRVNFVKNSHNKGKCTKGF